MANGNLLEIYYDRVIKTEQVILTIENCEIYGYLPTTANIDGKTYTVFYKKEDSANDYVEPVIDKMNNAITTISYETTKRYSHIAPPCSRYEFSFADVDKEGSGRNSLTGEMFRERIGSYSMLSVAWNLIPDTIEYNNWYRILTHLPTSVYLKMLLPTGEIVEKKMYRGDISTSLYLFVENAQIWRGLSTTFTQWNVEKYDDSIEPELIE